jgi:glycosyltransferase involved in cell wall biosynthesis
VHNGHFDLLHGWAARDWELTALVGALTRCPTVGTLHDDPQARFLSPKRQKLMRWCANRGLNRLICISDAVKSACITAGYDPTRLTRVHNGLPRPKHETWHPGAGAVRLGFIGALGERKGLRGLFQMLDHLSQITTMPWEMFIAGEAIEPDGEALVKALQAEYSNRAWYSRLHWCGWVDQPLEFLSGIDLLICPSSEFEPFGLVLCEAGWMGIPVLGTRVGGIPEIVEDGKTGWLIDAGNWRKGAERLAEAVGNQALRRSVGELGRQRVQKHFAIEKMVAEYLQVYASILSGP